MKLYQVLYVNFVYIYHIRVDHYYYMEDCIAKDVGLGKVGKNMFQQGQ